MNRALLDTGHLGVESGSIQPNNFSGSGVVWYKRYHQEAHMVAFTVDIRSGMDRTGIVSMINTERRSVAVACLLINIIRKNTPRIYDVV